MTATYATPVELVEYLGINGEVPDLDTSVKTNRVNEEVGTGDDSTTQFFLNQGRIVSGTYTLYYGSATTTSTTLIDVTDYTLNLNTGEITLTAAGVTKLGTDNIYAKYTYITIGLKNSQIQDYLNKAQAEIDHDTVNHWANITDDTPDWIIKTNEKQRGKGRFDKDYYVDCPPIPDVSTTLDEAITTADETITVVSTTGFPSSGIIGISNLKISYTGKTATEFTGCTGVTSDVADETAVYPYVFEASTTVQGVTPEYVVLSPGDEYDVDLRSGRVYLYNERFLLDITTLNAAPQRLLPDRFRMTYISGESVITEDIKRLCLMIAAKDIMHLAVKKAHATGRNNFEPDLIDVDEKWIEATKAKHTIYKSDNV